MKKQFSRLSVFIITLLALSVGLFSCGGGNPVEFSVDFVVDGETYATVTTGGGEAISLPENPTKEGYDFDGWYWDNETFTKPFTAESLLNAPLSADMSVYAKWKIGAHTHTPGDWVVDKNATCSEAGSKHNVCTFCGATVETAAIEKLAHTPEVVPGKPQTDTEDGLTDGSRCSVCSEVLTAQQTIPANLQSTALKSANLTVSGDKITGSVSNTTEIFSFANDITVAKNASYVVATDISCSQTIASKTVTLSIGDNTFYILVSCGNDVKLYYVTLRRLPTYTVTFNENGGPSVANQIIEEGSLATEPVAPARAGYTFTGWDYDFTSPITQNTTVSATWTANTNTVYKVDYYLEKLDGTYELKETENLAGTTDTTATAEIKTFEHFTHDTEAGTLSGNIAGDGSLVLKVYYTRDSYTVTTSINNSLAGSVTAGGVYKYGTEITVRVSVNQGYTYNGIFSGAEKRCEGTEYTFTVSENITLTAEAIANTDTPYTVKYYKQNSTGGYDLIDTQNLVGTTDTIVTAVYDVPEGFRLNEYKSNISGNIAGDGSLVLAVYYWIPYYNRNGDYIYFGEYPQTLKADSVTITETQDTRGYYLGSDGFYYAKVVADPDGSDYTFSTGASVTYGETYYFKVETIRWRILSEDGETAIILCDSIIAKHRYDDSSNNYANSEIRQWLNDTFYETAFTELQREMILTTNVDNSVASTGYSSNSYACEDTEDKIFLLSYKEATNSAYGFSTSYSTYDEARRMQTSDYCRATGVYMNTLSGYYGNGVWWLRSPDSDISFRARYVRSDGDVGYGEARGSNRGVVPALQIRL